MSKGVLAMKMRKLFKKGFTLVELVVVIAVIAVLAAVSVGAYFGVTDSANSSNATVSQKQVKDYWMLYSIEEYDDSKSLSEIGDDFCIRYLIEYQGYNSTYVNYAKVTIGESVSSLAGSETTENALLFKIETQYPTYLLVKEDRIIETSSVAKNEEELATIIDLSSFNIIENGSEIEFELSTIIYNDEEVRGHSYIQLDVDNFKGSLKESEDIVFVKSGKTLISADPTYKPSQFKIANGQTEDVFSIKNIDNSEFDSEADLITESNISSKKLMIIDIIILISNMDMLLKQEK